MSIETAAFVCSHVFDETRPALFVSRAEGDWQLLCGGEHEHAEVPRVIGLQHLLNRDSTLLELQDLAPDWEAERTQVGASWHRMRVGSTQQ